MRRRRVILVAAAAVLIIAPAGWYFGSPWWTLWRIREAARAGDMNRLASYVDAKAVQARFVAEGKTFWRSMLAIAMARSTDPVGQRLVAQARRRLAYAAPATLDRTTRGASTAGSATFLSVSAEFGREPTGSAIAWR